MIAYRVLRHKFSKKYSNPNLSCVRNTTVCSYMYKLQKQNCPNTAELPLSALENFVYSLAYYRQCLRFFANSLKIQRIIVLCSSELFLDRPQKLNRTFDEKCGKQRTKFQHFACITFVQYCRLFAIDFYEAIVDHLALPAITSQESLAHNLQSDSHIRWLKTVFSTQILMDRTTTLSSPDATILRNLPTLTTLLSLFYITKF